MNPHPPRSTLRSAAFLPLGILAAVLAVGVRRADAQAEIRRFTDPILVLDTGGHHATPRALAFAQDGRTLLSAGLDKVVHGWDLAADPPRRSRTIRPPIWRGTRGEINALSLSPPGPDGQSILAVAGSGVENRGGTIALYRFPGSPRHPTGDLIGYLYVKNAPVAGWSDGHENTIGSMAFSPDGRWLATGSADGTVKLWDPAARRVVATLDHAGGRVGALAFATPTRLMTGTQDGFLRDWDLSGLPAQAPPAPRSQIQRTVPGPNGVATPVPVNAVAASADGRWLVAGYENGQLLRIDLNAAELRLGAAPLPTTPAVAGASIGPIEAVAIGPNNRLAVSRVARGIAALDERPDPACVVELRPRVDLANPAAIAAERSFAASNLVYALAFSPDGRRLAYAGGDDQAVVVRDLTDPQSVPVAFRGTGRSVWHVGFDDRSRIVAFSDLHAGAPASEFSEAYDLTARAPTQLAAANFRGPVEVLDGWTVTPESPTSLRVAPPAGVAGGFVVSLDSSLDGRWWAYSFLPAQAPGHPRPVLAVACNRGVAIYDLQTGARTRFLAGHEGPVYALAPSPDGRWLATGSADQTVRLWTLEGIDGPTPALGATFERQPDGRRLVTAVEPGGFAEGAGLLVGDVVELLAIGQDKARVEIPDDAMAALGGQRADVESAPVDPAALDALFDRIDEAGPNVPVNFLVRRRVPGLAFALGLPITARGAIGTTRRDRPALSLFVGEDQEWVLWSPRGYYDTSVIGDERLIGWHLNNATIYRPRPTDFVPMARFADRLREPRRRPQNRIESILTTGRDPVQPGPEPAQVVRQGQPADLAIAVAPAADLPANLAAAELRPGEAPAAPAALPAGEVLPDTVFAGAGTLALNIEVDAAGREPLESIEVLVDGRPVPLLRAPDLTDLALSVPVLVDLAPGAHKLLVRARNAAGVVRQRALTIASNAPAPPPAGRLRIIGIAPTFPQQESLNLRFNVRDVTDLTPFLRERLVRDAEGTRFETATGGDVSLTEAAATSSAIADAVGNLTREGYGPADMVVLLVETHVLNFGSKVRLATADGHGVPPDPALDAEVISDAVEKLARSGCRVLVMIDGIHTGSAGHWDTDLTEWARDLRSRRGAVVAVASKQKPGLAAGAARNGAFATAVLDSIKPGGRFARADQVRTLDQFREIVIARVLESTRRRQHAEVYIPDTIAGGIPLIDPR